MSLGDERSNLSEGTSHYLNSKHKIRLEKEEHLTIGKSRNIFVSILIKILVASYLRE